MAAMRAGVLCWILAWAAWAGVARLCSVDEGLEAVRVVTVSKEYLCTTILNHDHERGGADVLCGSQ